VRVGLGIEHHSSNSSREQEETSSDTNNSNGPSGKESVNLNNCSLTTVGEVVVSGAHVVESSSLVHADESTIEIGRCGIEFHAVLNVRCNVSCIVVVLGSKLISCETVGLTQVSHVLSEGQRIKKCSVGIQPSISCGSGRIEAGQLNHVGSVSSCSSFTSISSWVGVASSPLEVDVVSLSSNEEGGYKIVLGGRISLHDISSLSSNVEVEDSLKRRDSIGTWVNSKNVSSVLEGSSELGSVHCESEVDSTGGRSGVLFDGSIGIVHLPVNEVGVGSGGIWSSISSRDVVSESQDTVAVVSADARKILVGWESPVVGGGETIDGVTQVVVSRPSGLNADWSGDAKRLNLGPNLTRGLSAGRLSDGSSLNSVGISTEPSWLDVL